MLPQNAAITSAVSAVVCGTPNCRVMKPSA